MKKIKKFTQDWSNSGGNGMGIMGPSEGGLGFGTPGGGGEGLGNRINLPPSHQGHSGNLAPGPWSGDNIIDESLKTGFFSQSIGDFTVEELISKIRALMKIDTRESRDLVVFLKRILDDKMRRVKAARRAYDTDKIAINSTAVAQLKQDPFTIALFAEHNVPISKLDNVEVSAEVSHFTLHTLVHKIATTDLVGTIEQGLNDIETKVSALEKPDTTLDPIYIQNIYTELSEVAETFVANSSDITNSKELSAKIRELKRRIDGLKGLHPDNDSNAEEATIPTVYPELVKFLNEVRVLYNELVAGKGSLEQVDNYVSEFEELKQEIQSPTRPEKMLMTLINAMLIRISNAAKHFAPQILNTLKQTPIDNWPDLIDQLKQTYTEKQLHYFFEYSGEWKDMFAALRTKFGAGEPVAKISKQDFYDFYTAMLALTYSADAPSSVQNALARAILRLAEAVVSGTRFGIRYHIEHPLLGAPAVWAKVKSRFGSLQDVFTAFHNDKLSTEDLVALTYLAYEEAPSMLDVWRPIAIEAAKLDKLVEQGVDLQGIAQQTDHLIDYAHHRGKIGEDWLPIQGVVSPVELMTEKSEKWDEKFYQEHSPRFYNIYKRLQRISKLRGFTKLAQGTAQPFKGKCPESDKTVYTTHSEYVQNDFKADCPEGKRKLKDMKSVSIEEYKKHKKKRKKKHKGYSLVSTKVEKYLRVHSPEMNGIQKEANNHVYAFCIIAGIEEKVKGISKKYQLAENEVRKFLDYDPTSNKAYLDWIVKQRNNLRDAQHTQDVLKVFEKAKKATTFQKKDINQYKTFNELEQILASIPEEQLETQRGKKKQSQETGSKIILTKPPYQVIEVNTPEAAAHLFRNTEWCVKDPKFFNEYKPPFYMITKNGQPWILIHELSDQVKDVNDEEVGVETLQEIESFYKIPYITNKILYMTVIEPALTSDKRVPKDVEKIISKNPEWAYYYAKDIIQERWPEAENTIKQDAEYATYYAKDIIQERWPEAENIIKQNAEYAYYYAIDVIQGRWPEAEDIIKQNAEYAYYYAIDVIKGRWPEAEDIIKQNAECAYVYARDAIKGRWPEAEDTIKQNGEYAYGYARNIIQGRWPEAEDTIRQDAYHWEKYQEFINLNQPQATSRLIAFIKYSQKSLSFTPEEQQIINAVKETADELNIKCYLVGGSVRDKLLGKEESDLDFMCENRAEELVARLNEKYNTSDPVQYDRSKALMVTLGGKPLDFINAERLFIPLKQDDESLEGEEEFTTSFDDAYRRDLTINTLMYDLSTGEIVDPTSRGLKDLREGVINTVIDPFIKFKVHAPDMLRALRFAVSLGFELGPNMIEAMRSNAGRVRPRDKGGDISNRRIRRELRKVIDTPEHWAKMRELISEVGLDIILADDVDDVQADFEGSIPYHWPEKQGEINMSLKRFAKSEDNDDTKAGAIKQFVKTSGVWDLLKGKPQTIKPTTGKERYDYLAQKLDEILAKTPPIQKTSVIKQFFNNYMQLTDADKQQIVNRLQFYKKIPKSPKKLDEEVRWVD